MISCPIEMEMKKLWYLPAEHEDLKNMKPEYLQYSVNKSLLYLNQSNSG